MALSRKRMREHHRRAIERADSREQKQEINPDDIIGYDGYPDPDTEELDHEGIRHHTEKAAFILIDGEDRCIPKSQIVTADYDTVTVTTWWLEQEE